MTYQLIMIDPNTGGRRVAESTPPTDDELKLLRTANRLNRTVATYGVVYVVEEVQ